MTLNKIFLTAVTAIALAGVSPTVTAAYTSITVFGDSLSDGGNGFLFSGGNFPPPPYAQRSTNGPTAVEVLAGNLYLPLTPSLLGGSNYAFNGAETGAGNFLAVRPDVPPAINFLFSGPPNFPATGVAAQVQSFLGGGGTFTPSSLVVLWAGPNDLFTSLQTGIPPLANVIPNALNNLGAEVTALYGAGARHILMPNMANIGATPFGLATNPVGLTTFSIGFNLGLDGLIDLLELSLPGLDIIEFDTFSALNQLIANAAALGFGNPAIPCVDAALQACANPNASIFWDTVHPTARVHGILGDLFTNTVPEPTALALLSLALATAGFCRRRKLSVQ